MEKEDVDVELFSHFDVVFKTILPDNAMILLFSHFDVVFKTILTDNAVKLIRPSKMCTNNFPVKHKPSTNTNVFINTFVNKPLVRVVFVNDFVNKPPKPPLRFKKSL